MFLFCTLYSGHILEQLKERHFLSIILEIQICKEIEIDKMSSSHVYAIVLAHYVFMHMRKCAYITSCVFAYMGCVFINALLPVDDDDDKLRKKTWRSDCNASQEQLQNNM